MKTPLTNLENQNEFIGRHIGLKQEEESAITQFLGFKDRKSVIDAVIPDKIRRHDALPLADYLNAQSEKSALALLASGFATSSGSK